jgi:hypothetical protein
MIWESDRDEADCRTESAAWLRNDIGHSQFLLEGAFHEDEVFYPLLIVPLQIEPRPEVARDFFVMLDSVIAFHEGMAQDIVGRAWVEHSQLKEQVSRLQPLHLTHYLERLYQQLHTALMSIARQPSMRLMRTSRTVRYRGGELLDAASVSSICRWSETEIDINGRFKRIGRIRVRKHCLTEDLVEHRHIAAEIKRLSRKALELAKHCEHRADLISQGEKHWYYTRSVMLSEFQRYYQPRIEAYRSLEKRSREVAYRFRELIARHSFLANSEPPRTPFGPTPVFLGRSSYREVYHLLLNARLHFGVLFDEDEIRLHYRDFPSLYEVWCLVQVLTHLQKRFGLPQVYPPPIFQHEIYMPNLEAEQSFHFKISRSIQIIVTYQHQFPPWRQASRDKHRWVSAFTSEPLRPDITIQIIHSQRPPVILVFDAKSTDHFRPIQFREMADYSRQIFEFQTGNQPVKQVFLLHRDRNIRSSYGMTNIPGYLQGRHIHATTSILGAIPLFPDILESPAPPISAKPTTSESPPPTIATTTSTSESPLPTTDATPSDRDIPLETTIASTDTHQEQQLGKLLSVVIDRFLHIYGCIPPHVSLQDLQHRSYRYNPQQLLNITNIPNKIADQDCQKQGDL